MQVDLAAVLAQAPGVVAVEHVGPALAGLGELPAPQLPALGLGVAVGLQRAVQRDQHVDVAQQPVGGGGRVGGVAGGALDQQQRRPRLGQGAQQRPHRRQAHLGL